MFSQIDRDEDYLRCLVQHIEVHYGFPVESIAAAARGWYGETWKVTSASQCYFVKIVFTKKHMARYARSFPVVAYLCSRGIDFISTIVKTKDSELCCPFQGGILGLFQFIDGVHTEEYALESLFARLSAIYSVPCEALDAERETFGMRHADAFRESFGAVKSLATAESAALTAAIEKESEALAHRAHRLQTFSILCEKDCSGLHITSGDTGGNVIMQGDRLFIIDWDYIMLAPIERDLWFYMHDDGQVALINRVLAANGIHYSLQQGRLAYYCYSSFFYYLCEYLNCFLECDDKRKALIDEVTQYLDGEYWIYHALRKADGI